MRASELAKKVADEGGALTLGGICQCPTYLSNVGKEAVQEEFRKQIQVFVEAGLDFLLCEVVKLQLSVAKFFNASFSKHLQFFYFYFLVL